MPLTAKEARKLSEDNSSVDIEVFVRHIDSKIVEACKNGNNRIIYPFHGLKEWPTNKQRKKVECHYNDSGFKWVNHSNPDPSHPCSADYEEIKW